MEMRYILTLCLVLCSIIGNFSCGGRSDDIIEIQEYTGPIREGTNLVLYRSDSALVTIKMETPRVLDFGNGDQEYPEGFFLEFYDKLGNPTSSLRADYCYYTRKDNLYKATGNVVIQDNETKDKLNTEELFWDEKKGEVFTDKFVRIEKEGELHMGDGLEAKQDISYWRILNPKGTISLNE
jgi:LPS export ABC transporter protein LptC